MKIRAFVVFALILCGIGAVVCWTGAATRPFSAEKAVTKAIQAQNTPLLIQALITKMKNQLEKNDDTFPELIGEVETYTAQCTDSAAVAVLHSMLAEMYQTYYFQNQWTINQRTDLEGYIPKDIREWTSNLFTTKIKQELTASLQPAALLQQTPVSEFKPILEIGANSAELRPTLYDFLAGRAIDIQPSETFYRELLAFRQTQPNKQAYLLDELDYLRYKYQDGNTVQANQQYQAALDSLMKAYAGTELSNEIRIAQVELLQRMPYRADWKNYSDSLNRRQYEICKEGIERFPGYSRTGILKNALARLTQPQMTMQANRTVYPGEPMQISLKYTNVPKITLRIYESLRMPQNAFDSYDNPGNKGKKTIGKLVKEVAFTLPATAPYIETDTVLFIPTDNRPGLYECVISAPGRSANTLKSFQIQNVFSVTRLATVHRNLPSRQTEVWVTDYETGKPVSEAHVTYYARSEKGLQPLGTIRADKEGLCRLPFEQKIAAYRAMLPGDTAALPTFIYPSGTYQPDEKNPIQLSLFTDRGIYRPGQSLFFKGIAYVEGTDDPHVVSGQSFTVLLRDANGKEIAHKSLKTDAFGSFNGEFTLPRQTLSGNFTLEANQTRRSFRVEEYKRPTFRIDIDPLREEVSFGRPVVIRGKAETFSGVALQTGQVTWQINSRPFWFRGFVPGNYMYTSNQIANGTASIDDKGNFTLTFTPEREAGFSNLPFYSSYELVATLTDSKGETEEARYTFSVGDTGILLSIDLPAVVEKDSAKAIVSAYTINGQKAAATGTFIIRALTERLPQNDFEETRYEAGNQVASGNFSTGEAIGTSVFRSLPAGRYRLEATAKDQAGQRVKGQADFVLYGRHDKRPPVFSPTWLIKEKTSCLPGEEAVFVFGTSEKEAYILYEIFSNGQTEEKKLIKMSDENRTFRIPFKAAYGEGFVASFTFVKDGKMYATTIPVERRRPDRRITILPETFRDHLLPGSQESWTFRLLDADSTAVAAEVLASMYDASLDELLPFRWTFSPVPYVYLPVPRFTEGNGFSKAWQYENANIAWVKVPEYQFDRLNWQGVLSFGRRYNFYNLARGNGMLMKSAQAAPAMAADAASVVEEKEEAGALMEPEVVRQEGVADIIAEEAIASPSPLRENFAETAFFYPVLVTNPAGDVSFRFTVPQSNTTWKLQLLAQTKDLKYGYWSKKVVTSKPLMVLPNLPRFMRQGDEVTITTQIINQSDKNIEGRVRLELFDPANDQPIVCLSKSQKPFALSADSMTTARWTVPVPSRISLIGCRIIADSDNGSDGEQHLIPVLSNQVLITESTPFYLDQTREKQIRLPGSSQSAPFRLTLELSANPVWYAIQALPTLTQPAKEDVLSWFASYYSNTLAASIVKAHPRIRQVIGQWTAQGGNASTLLSNLEKNEELKNILLEETPWVLAAENETEQKARLSLLFDLNRADNLRETALQQLIQQQTEEGGWSWFKGFPASRLITQSILKGMAQLVELNAVEYGQQEKEMQIKALNFLDRSILSDYEQQKKQNKNLQDITPSPLQVSYLYVRSAYRDIPEWGEAREAIRFYTAQAEKSWQKQSLYGKGEIALLMYRNGKKEAANEILAWLRKTATVSEEMGMYWANNRRGTDYFTSPLEVHTLLMSAFREINPSARETDLLKQWLLNQKRTQSWESVPATVNAIYALVLTGADWLDQNNTCTVQWGGHTFQTAGAGSEAAIGYLKEVIDQQEITPAMKELTVRKNGNAPAWGAVYTQYFEPLTAVKQQKGVLNVERKLFIESNSGTGLQISPVTADRPLRVGDKVIVRLTIRTDRELDYVFLKDLRAGCFEPANQLSGAEFWNQIWYYRSPEDVSENFFFNRLPAGTFVLEYAVYVARTGQYAGGISTIQCMYAPEFISHTEGGVLKVE